MGYETLLVSKEEGVGIITLNRPQVLNAMNFKLVTELDQAITGMEEDEDVKAIILTGAGRAFSAGGDIHEQREEEGTLSEEERDKRQAIRSEYFWHLAYCKKPTIGAMNGLAYGGGAVLASSLDMRVGCANTSFRFLAAAYGRLNSTWTLPNLIGLPLAKELLFTGRVVEAEEAYRLGLLNHLVSSERLMEKAMEIGTTIAKNRPASVQGIKYLLSENIGTRWREQWGRELDFRTTKVKGWGVEQAFKDFLEKKGR